MKATGVVRSLDRLGRVVLPKELRVTQNLQDGDGLEIFVEGNTIMLRKYEPACVFCGSLDGLAPFHGRNVCQHCREHLGQAPA